MIFECKTEVEKWKGKVKNFIDHGSHYEILIESRSSILILFGKTSLGGFACIPDFQAGCHLVNLKDKFWNTEKLTSVLGEIDGVTVANALYQLTLRYPDFNC